MGEERSIDVRWLDSPAPFERVVAELEVLPSTATLRVQIHREPHPLYQWLTHEGFSFRTHFNPEGWFEILITR
jgi:hypothetical protein